MSYQLPQEVIDEVLSSDPHLSAAIEAVYNLLEGNETAEEYHRRHMTSSLGVLTAYSPIQARRIVKPLRGRILNRTVVEIGAGVGLVALELAKYSPKVFAIESDPAWAWIFTEHLYAAKPPHLTWIFGRAEEVSPWLRADVAVIVTRSGHAGMKQVARRMANEVIDVYEENPMLNHSEL
jgi:hypothetical protein